MAVVPPPYSITEVDKQGLIVVITAITFSFTWSCFGIRIWLRYRSIESWKLDDVFLAGATVVNTAQSAVMFNAVAMGMGKSLDLLPPSGLDYIGKSSLSAHVLYIGSLFLSKCAICLLYLRLSPCKRHVHVSRTAIAISAAWAFISAATVIVPCNDLDFWRYGSRGCPSITVTAFDIFTEAAIILIPSFLVVGLNMSRKAKLLVVLAFGARIPVIVAAALRLHYLRVLFSSQDRTLDATYYAIATQWHVSYAIMSTTITGLGPFLRPYSKSFASSYHPSAGQDRLNPIAGPSHESPHTKSHVEIFEMQSIDGNSDALSIPWSAPSSLLIPEQASHRASIIEGDCVAERRIGQNDLSRLNGGFQYGVIRNERVLTSESIRLKPVIRN